MQLGLSLSLTRAGMAAAFAELNLLAPTLDPRINFTRASTKTYIGADGLLHTAAANECPLEYDPVTLQPVGRSFWEARTNLLLGSDAPVTQSVTTTAQSYTLSFTGTGTVTLSGAYAGTLVGKGTGPANRVSLTFTSTAASLTVTISGSVVNAQLEAAATPGPYIPTTSAAVTRAADVATVDDLSKLRFNASEGTLFAVADKPLAATGFPSPLYFGSASDYMMFYYNAASSVMAGKIGVGGVTQAENAISAAFVSGTHKIALAYKQNDVSGAADGVVRLNDVNASIPVMSGARIGSQVNNANYWNAPIRRIRVYPRKLTNAELQAITA